MTGAEGAGGTAAGAGAAGGGGGGGAGGGGGTRVWRAAFYVAALLLVTAAVWVAVRERDAFWAAWTAARGAPAWMVAALLVLPLMSWVLTVGVFQGLTRLVVARGERDGAVSAVRAGGGGAPRLPSHAEMGALIGASWLLNYLPIKPGLIGRVAWHRAVNRIRVRDSLVALLLAIVCTFLAAGLLIALAWGHRWAAPNAPHWGGWSLWAVLAAPAALALLAEAGAPARWRGLGLAFACRYVDLWLLAVRLWIGFAMIGRPEGATSAVVIAASAQALASVPLLPFGVQEWVAGLLAADVRAGLMAGLVNRVCELLWAAVVGGLSLSWLAKNRARLSGDAGGG